MQQLQNELVPDLFSPATYVAAMGAAATGVSVVTTIGPAGRFGLTVSAVTSVSADPPLLLVCVNRKSPTVAAISQNGRFAVSFLAEHQSAIARNFSGQPEQGPAYVFAAENWWSGQGGLPVLHEAAAHFECEIESFHEAGTHRIFIGKVTGAERGNRAPLVYSSRAFARTAPCEGKTQ